MIEIPGYPIERAIPLFSHNYYRYLGQALSNARLRIWASIFLVDARVRHDPHLLVRGIFRRLAAAKQRNLDVRILIGGISDNHQLRISNLTSIAYLQTLRIPTREFRAPNRNSTHSKYILVDNDTTIVGSHNWTNSAFTKNLENSVAVLAEPLARDLQNEFEINWDLSREGNEHGE